MACVVCEGLPPVVVFGCGFVGTVAARQAMSSGRMVRATVRSAEQAASLERLGIQVRALAGTMQPRDARELVPDGAHVLIAFPPDGQSDDAVAEGLAAAKPIAITYISTTGVYGSIRGRVDERTPVDALSPRMRLRLHAEEVYRRLGATILRAAGIYGPGRGLHRRVLDPTFRPAADPNELVSRVHVDDLARLALRALVLFDRQSAGVQGRVYVVADDEPTAQIVVVRWLCAKLGLPLPDPRPSASKANADTATIRDASESQPRAPGPCSPAISTGHVACGRFIDNRRIKSDLGLDLLYPTYREGLSACLEIERSWGGGESGGREIR